MSGLADVHLSRAPALQVVPLSAGECLNFAAITEQGAPWRVRAYPAGFALLIHPRFGPVLFDTGYGEAVLTAIRRWPGCLYGLVTPVRLRTQETALAQLERLGFSRQEVQFVILSHLHADHIGGLLDFPQAGIIIDHRAYQPLRNLRGLRAVRKAFLPELLPDDFLTRLSPLQFCPTPPELAPFAEYADVFGDGTALALPVPGHAPGMIALLVRTVPWATLSEDGAGWVLLAADAAWSVRGLRESVSVHPLGRLAFDNPQAEAHSATALREWLARFPGVRIIVSHDAPESSSLGGNADV